MIDKGLLILENVLIAQITRELLALQNVGRINVGNINFCRKMALAKPVLCFKNHLQIKINALFQNVVVIKGLIILETVSIVSLTSS
jgi:hypothetical protein